MDPLWTFITNWLIELQIAFIRSVTTLLWWLEKVSAYITQQFLQSSTLDTILSALLQSLKSVFPTILQNLFFGQGGLSTGLFYLALMLGGLVLILPHLGEARRIIEPGRAIIWAVFVSTLFITATAGYDLMFLIESLRQQSAQMVVAAVSSNGSLVDLVAKPMMGTPGEVFNYDWQLPTAFEAHYFPPRGTTHTEEMVLWDFWIGRWALEIRVEDATSIQNRSRLAQNGGLMATLTLFPAYVLLLFGITFAMLTVSALILMLFFLAALPLGLFSFADSIFVGLVRQYGYLFILTLVAAIFPALLLGVGNLTLTGSPTVQNMVAYLPLLIIVIIAGQYVAKMGWSLLNSSFGVVTSSIHASVGSYAVYGSAPAPTGQEMPSNALRAAGLAVGGMALGAGVLAVGALAGVAGGGALAEGTATANGGATASGGATVSRGGAGAAAHAFGSYAGSRAANKGGGNKPQGDHSSFFRARGADQSVLAQPDGAQRLAQGIRQSPDTWTVGNAPVGRQLHDLAQSVGLSEESLTRLIDAVQEGVRFGSTTAEQEKIVREQVGKHADLRALPEPARDELSRLTLSLVRDQLPPMATTPPPANLAAQIIHQPMGVSGDVSAAYRLNDIARLHGLNEQMMTGLIQTVQEGLRQGLGRAEVATQLQLQLPDGSKAIADELARLISLVSATSATSVMTRPTPAPTSSRTIGQPPERRERLPMATTTTATTTTATTIIPPEPPPNWPDDLLFAEMSHEQGQER